MTRILVPTDFSEPSLAAVRYAVDLTFSMRGDMLLLHVIEGDPVRNYMVGGLPDPPSLSVDVTGNLFRWQLPKEIIRHDRYEEAQWKLTALLPPGFRDRFRSLVVVGRAADEILRAAREQKADLIIMGSHRRKAVRHILRRSVADKVIRKAPIPVITLWGLGDALSHQHWVSKLALREWPEDQRRRTMETNMLETRSTTGSRQQQQSLKKDGMRVRDVMTSAPISVPPSTPVHEARNLMQQHRIRHLPVLDNGRLVGIVTDRDIRLVLPSPATSLSVWEINYLLARLTVGKVMTPSPITVAPDRDVTEAISLMLTHKIGALPVIETQRLVGILTRTNLLQAFLMSQVELPGAA